MKLKSVVMIGLMGAMIIPTTVNAGTLKRLEEQRAIVNESKVKDNKGVMKISEMKFRDTIIKVVELDEVSMSADSRAVVWSNHEYDLNSKLSSHLIIGRDVEIDNSKEVEEGEVLEVLHKGYKYTYEVDQAVVNSEDKLSREDIHGLEEGVTGYDLTISFVSSEDKGDEVVTVVYLDLKDKAKLTPDDIFNADKNRLLKIK